MQLSVVIATYNDGPLLEGTIAPLLADPATGELVVVFDGSDDGSYEVIRTRAEQDPRIRPFLIQNRGRPGACQFGIDQARGDVVLLLDADVVAQGRLVSGHARWHQDGVARLVVGYMPVRPCARRPGSFVKEHYARLYEERSAAFERDPQSIFSALWAGNVSLPRRALQQVGGFDAGIGLRYNDDLELGLRLAGAGLEPVFDRSLLAEHLFERSVPGFLATARRYGEDLVRIDARHPGKAQLPPPPRSRLDARLRGLVIRPRLRRTLLRAGTAALGAAGHLGLYEAEQWIAHRLERIEIEVGMRRGQAALLGHRG